MLLEILMYGLNCARIRRTDMVRLEKFHKKAVTWILSTHHERYFNQLRILNLLPVPMYIQLNDILTLSQFKNNRSEHIVLPEINELPKNCLIYKKPEPNRREANLFQRHSKG